MSLQNRQSCNIMQYTFASLHTEHNMNTVLLRKVEVYGRSAFTHGSKGLVCIAFTQGDIQNMNFLSIKGKPLVWVVHRYQKYQTMKLRS